MAATGIAAVLAPRTAPSTPARRVGRTRFPDVPLLTHEGKRVRFYSDLIQGRIVFINMTYTQCNNTCPPMTQNLKRVHEALGARAGRDIFMYSITLLPEFDRPADLKAFMELNQIGPGWTFLTGAKGDIEQVRASLGFVDPDPQVDAEISQHTGMVRIGNDALDRWSMAPARLEPELILESLMAIDPVSRATPRPLRAFAV